MSHVDQTQSFCCLLLVSLVHAMIKGIGDSLIALSQMDAHHSSCTASQPLLQAERSLGHRSPSLRARSPKTTWQTLCADNFVHDLLMNPRSAASLASANDPMLPKNQGIILSARQATAQALCFASYIRRSMFAYKGVRTLSFVPLPCTRIFRVQLARRVTLVIHSSLIVLTRALQL